MSERAASRSVRAARRCISHLACVILAVSGPIEIAPRAARAGEPNPWVNAIVEEAFPGSLSMIDSKHSTVGGASSCGSAAKGNYAINANGQMVLTRFESDRGTRGRVRVARSEDGATWVKADLPGYNDNRLGGVGSVIIATGHWDGLGPLCRIDDRGRICVVVLGAGMTLDTFLWPASASKPSHACTMKIDDRKDSCGNFMPGDLEALALEQYSNTFYLGMVANGRYSVRKLVGSRWRPLGNGLPAVAGKMAWDDATKRIYLGLIVPSLPAGDLRPAVFQWIEKRNTWDELKNKPSPGGLHESPGVAACAGAEPIEPGLVAHDGIVWCFWSQQERDGCRIQGAKYRAGVGWGSCLAESSLFVGEESAGKSHESSKKPERWIANYGPSRQQCSSIFAARDPDGALLLFWICCACPEDIAGLSIKGGAVRAIRFSRPSQPKPERLLSHSAFSAADASGPSDGWALISTGYGTPHTISFYYKRGVLYLHATEMCSLAAKQQTDVFVFRITMTESAPE